MPPEHGRANGHKQHNLQLLLASLQTGSQRLREGAAIAFTSASHGEGVTRVTQLFAVEMARYTGRRTLVIDAERLQSLGVEDYLQMPWNCHPTNIENLWMLPAKKKKKHTNETQALPKRSFLMRVAKEGETIDTGLDSVGPIGHIGPMKKTILLIAISLLTVPLVAHAQDPRPPRLTTVTEDRYRLQPGDVLEIQYRYSPEFNQTVTVQPDGYITLEVGGDLKVAGMTVDQTRQAILKQASTRLQDPIATVILKDRKSVV